MKPTPLAWAIFTDEGLIRIWSTVRTDVAAVAEAIGKTPIPLYDAPTLQPKQSNAAADVLAERRRQIAAEGMTTAGDDQYRAAELPRAAAAYILNGANEEPPCIWPWAKSWWKPRDARANYVRAAALLLAEIERIDRQQPGLPIGLQRPAQGGEE